MVVVQRTRVRQTATMIVGQGAIIRKNVIVGENVIQQRYAYFRRKNR